MWNLASGRREKLWCLVLLRAQMVGNLATRGLNTFQCDESIFGLPNGQHDITSGSQVNPTGSTALIHNITHVTPLTGNHSLFSSPRGKTTCQTGQHISEADGVTSLMVKPNFTPQTH